MSQRVKSLLASEVGIGNFYYNCGKLYVYVLYVEVKVRQSVNEIMNCFVAVTVDNE